MTMQHHHLLLLLVLAAAAAVAAGEEGAVFSSHTCSGESPNTRTCEFRNVCVDAAGAGWVYHAAPAARTDPLLAGDIARMGPASLRAFRVAVEHTPLPADAAPAEEEEEEEAVAVAFCGCSPTYTRWLLDDVFGTHWLLARHGVLRANASAVFVTSCGRSAPPQLLAHVKGLFSDAAPVALKDVRGRCFARLVVGPAGHYLVGNPKIRGDVTDQDIASFRAFMHQAAHVRKQEEQAEEDDADDHGAEAAAAEPSSSNNKITFVQRRDGRIVKNAFDLVQALGAASSSVEIVFLEDLTIDAQIDIVAHTRVLAASHGGALANMVFLEPGAGVVEIFPYGYHNPLYRDLAERLGLKYAFWQNPDRSKTVFHEKWLDHFGVTGAERKAALKGTSFDEETMSYLALSYWANQDTFVDPVAVTEAAKSVLVSEKKKATKDEL